MKQNCGYYKVATQPEIPGHVPGHVRNFGVKICVRK